MHVTRYAKLISTLASINASVVQGSGIGPSSYIVGASDLHPIHAQNKMKKYADDTYLLIGASMRNTTQEELDNVSDWAERNNLRLNAGKSKEMIIFRRSSKAKIAPPELEIERVTSMLILGVTINDDLGATSHVNAVLSTCSGSLFALRVLRAHGLPSSALHEVARATTISRLLYASPAWWGYTTAIDRLKLQRFLQKVKRLGYLPSHYPDLDRLIDDADFRLLKCVIWNLNHVLRSLFPPIVKRPYALRSRPHNFELPRKDDFNFISRVLFKTVRSVNSKN